MGNLVEGIIAATGLVAGIMVFLTTLGIGEGPWKNEEYSSPNHPRTIHREGDRIAA